jgi:hypothetical protein
VFELIEIGSRGNRSSLCEGGLTPAKFEMLYPKRCNPLKIERTQCFILEKGAPIAGTPRR